ncbi:MAG: mechanosensitive ion channel, partial [Clostridium sp.]|nr:mechanosensitive ion channel [Clostridium sp.]
MNDFTDQLSRSLPDILMGIVFLVIALVLGYVVKTLIVKGTRRLKLGRKLGDNAEDARNITELLGKLGFIITVLFFLPGIFDRFGLSTISDPLTGMVSTFFGFIPRLIGAGLLLFFGFVVAKVVQQLFKAFLQRMRVDRLKEKMGMEGRRPTDETPTLSIADLGGKILYVVVLIPFIIAALEILNIRTITEPAIAMLNNITAIIPQLIAAGVLILLGVFIAKVIGDLVENLINGFGLSRRVADAMDEPKITRFNLAKTTGVIVKALIILFFTVQAF